MSGQFSARWAGRTEPIFHDCAEALGINTSQIMGAMARNGRVFCMFSIGERIWTGVLNIEDDQTLREVERQQTEHTFDSMMAEIEARENRR
jgi:hypothetical protein